MVNMYYYSMEPVNSFYLINNLYRVLTKFE